MDKGAENKEDNKGGLSPSASTSPSTSASSDSSSSNSQTIQKINTSPHNPNKTESTSNGNEGNVGSVSPKSPSTTAEPIELPELSHVEEKSPPRTEENKSNIITNINAQNIGKRTLDGIPTELDGSNKMKKKNELLMTEENERLARKILVTLLKNPWAPPFETPVDTVSLGLSDYFDVIKRPMDLGTVSTNLDEKRYHTVTAFAEDVRLVFTNAKMYNEQRSDIHKAARSFLNEFDDLVKITNWNQVYDNKIPEVTTPIVTITKKPVLNPVKPDVTHIEEPKSMAVNPMSPPSPRGSLNVRNGNSKHGYNCLVYYQNETIPYDFEWQQLHSREEFESKLRAALNIPSAAELEIGIKRSKPNFGKEVFVQLSQRWEDFPKIACVLVKHRK